MRKFIVCAVIICAMCSCTSDSFFDETLQTQENVVEYKFDKEEADFQTFWAACQSVIEVHKDFDYFRDLLTDAQLEKIDNGTYNVDDAVGIIYLWWSNEETFDVMIEWPEFDDVIAYMPIKYIDLYGFYC